MSGSGVQTDMVKSIIHKVLKIILKGHPSVRTVFLVEAVGITTHLRLVHHIVAGAAQPKRAATLVSGWS